MATSLLPTISLLSPPKHPNRFFPKSQTLKPTPPLSTHLTPTQSTTFSCNSSTPTSTSLPTTKFLESFHDLELEDVTSGDFEVEEDDSDSEAALSFTTMAVPKKRTSRTKSKIRKNCWKRKANVAAKKAFSLAKSIATGNSKSFFVPPTK
uniref:Large ribosomal subunit protein bL32c n=1 Tax=Consolida orientalis TaxID=565971 RepID=A0A6G6CIJ2_9MAGN|nr:ribosomal protein L32 [Consolida orientalis]